MISVCQGEKIPRKGGPAITRSFVFTDLLRLKGVSDVVGYIEQQGWLKLG